MDCEGIDADTTVVNVASSLHGKLAKEDDSVEEVLEGLDSYMEDLNNRLAVSRMVSNSIIKAMSRAVEEQASANVAAKDVEIAGLQKQLRLSRSGIGAEAYMYGPELLKQEPVLTTSDGRDKHARLKEDIGRLKHVTEEQEKEIDVISEKVSSSFEFLGMDKALHADQYITISEAVLNLKSISNFASRQVHEMDFLCDEWKLEQEVESIVLWVYMSNRNQELELKLCQHVLPCENLRIKWTEKFNEISKLHDELEALLQSVSTPEIGCNASPGFECSNVGNNKKSDPFNNKKMSKHASSPSSLLNGKLENGGLENMLPENLEDSQLKHMSKDDLCKYFKDEITKMKREHESKSQQITEEYFRLKRELFREKESSQSTRRDTEVDILRKGIHKSMSKLKTILLEWENWFSFGVAENFQCFEGEHGTSLSADNNVRHVLTNKDRESKYITPKLCDNSAENPCPSFPAERDGHLEGCQSDATREAFIREEIYKCWLKEAIRQNRYITEESKLCSANLEELTEIAFREAVHDAEAILKQKLESSAIDYAILHEISGIIYEENVREAKTEICFMEEKYRSLLTLNKRQVFKLERVLSSAYQMNEELKNEVFQLLSSGMEKDIFIAGLVSTLQERERQLEHAYQSINNLKERVNQHEMLILDKSKEFELVKAERVEALQKSDKYLRDIERLNIQLKTTVKMLEETRKENHALLSIVKEKEIFLALAEAKESENRKNLESVNVIARGLFASIGILEDKVVKAIEEKSSRLDVSRCELNSVVKKANTLRWTADWCKKVLEKRVSDLKKAEAEVDLLGNQVDALLFLLEKIFVGLNHYSTILQHYPGIMDVLNLIKRELRRESGVSAGDVSNTAFC